MGVHLGPINLKNSYRGLLINESYVLCLALIILLCMLKSVMREERDERDREEYWKIERE